MAARRVDMQFRRNICCAEDRQETARVLDINRTTLYKKMKKYNLLIDEPMGVH